MDFVDLLIHDDLRLLCISDDITVAGLFVQVTTHARLTPRGTFLPMLRPNHFPHQWESGSTTHQLVGRTGPRYLDIFSSLEWTTFVQFRKFSGEKW